MKKLLFTALIAASSIVSAQGIDFGAKAGIVFNANDGFWEGMGQVSEGEGSTGFQLGAVLRARFAGFYVQPELLYVQTSNEYAQGKIKTKSLDIPVGVGKRFLGIAHAQVGPTFSYYFEDKLDVGNFVNASQDQFGVGFHIGAGVQVSKLLFDLRYQKGFGTLTSEFVQGNSKFQTENTPQQINLSVTYLF